MFKVTRINNGVVVEADSLLDIDLLSDADIQAMFAKSASGAQAALGLDSGGWVDVVMRRPAGDLTTGVCVNRDALSAILAACKQGNVPVVWIGPHGQEPQELK